MDIKEQANFIWSIADLLRGNFKQSEYGKVILPFTVLRRFDCVLAPSKEEILERNKSLAVSNKAPIFKKYTGHDYYNVSKFDFVNCNIYLPFFSKKSACLLKIDLLTSTQVFS